MTNLNYLQNTYFFKSEAIIKEIRENEFGKAVVLDETIFYPQGGGQPCDKGKISTDNANFIVEDVRLTEDGTVLHYGSFESGEFNEGDKVSLEIDKERRILNARNHSAGHLLDCAVEKQKIAGLKPTKGFHFPEGPYVEYDGTIENPAELIPVLQETVNNLIDQDLQVEKKDLSPEEAKKQGIWTPPGKSSRVVNFVGFSSCGCGGTHVNSASEIGKIIIRKIKSKKGKTKIAYTVQ